MNTTLTAEQLFQEAIKRAASDLHLMVGYPPTLRINGILIQLDLYQSLVHKDIETVFLSITNKDQQESFYLNRELDFGVFYEGWRFRVNAYYQKDTFAMSLRLIPNTILSLEELELPTILEGLAQYQQGFVLITGQTGQGKSTTLAAVVQAINRTRKAHIITIEDPIEFVYPRGQALVSQREVKKDTLSFHKALKSVLREDPDVIVIGEMRDYETISIALTLAETGHLVFSTLHTNTAAQTIDRIIDVFPEEQQPQVRTQLSNVMRGIVCQRLLPRSDREGRIAACELLFANTAISTLIREGKTFQIDNVIQTTSEQNMIIFERYLRQLINAGKIDQKTALLHAFRPRLMEELLK